MDPLAAANNEILKLERQVQELQDAIDRQAARIHALNHSANMVLRGAHTRVEYALRRANETATLLTELADALDKEIQNGRGR